MSGSLSDFIYATDAGVAYAVRMDTSNGIAVGNGAATPGTEYLPRRIKPRFAVYGTDDGLLKKKIYVQAQGGVAGLPLVITADANGTAATFRLLYTRGEQAGRSRANTGQTI